MTNKNKAQAATHTKFRTPIVAVMGHVDHGKTSLLDAIRGTSVTATEHGGITQNTRAHQIFTKAGNKITFIDTPGHVDFGYEVSRSLAAVEGAILLVDATKGVQAQTLANLYQAIENNLEIIPVVNKIDLPNADKMKTKKEIIEAHIQARLNDCFNEKEITNRQELIEALQQGYTFKKLVEEIETRFISVSSIVGIVTLKHITQAYRQGITKGFNSFLA